MVGDSPLLIRTVIWLNLYWVRFQKNALRILSTFNPADMTNPIGLNMFEFDTPDQKDFLVQEAINMCMGFMTQAIRELLVLAWKHIFRNCALLLMSDPAGGNVY